MTNFHLTEEAEEDLIDIWTYSAEQWGIDQADRYLSHMETCCSTITESPSIGRTMEGTSGIYLHRCEQHFVFYTDIGKAITIIAVLHSRMDLPRHILTRLQKM